jgi:hypothetical protein
VGQTTLLPFGRKACCGFFCPKNLTASAGFEPAILGILECEVADEMWWERILKIGVGMRELGIKVVK